ncbi:hypothetical protein V8F20_010169 [Naviculisporaceae sp. PSN 640]
MGVPNKVEPEPVKKGVGTAVASENPAPSTTPPQTQPPRELEHCRRCYRHYMTKQLDNPLVNTKCGNYHPGKVKTRRQMLAEEGKGLRSNYSQAYLNKRVWSCCFKVAKSEEECTAPSDWNYCANYNGNHEPGGG